MNCWVCFGGAICISSILLTSCTIGNGTICGPQTPLIYCDSGANQRAMNRKRYIEWWGKTNLSTDQRSRDWVACGGYVGGDYGPPFDQLRQEKRPDEVGESAAYERLSHEFQRCMLKNGYYYTGNCNSKAMRLEPMCADTKKSPF